MTVEARYAVSASAVTHPGLPGVLRRFETARTVERGALRKALYLEDASGSSRIENQAMYSAVFWIRLCRQKLPSILPAQYLLYINVQDVSAKFPVRLPGTRLEA
jgi:hypothetical protein